MIRRVKLERAVETALRRSPVVTLLGPRQCGKTTLARAVTSRWPGPVRTFDLESPAAALALEAAQAVLDPLDGLVVIDEVQRLPALLPVLRVLADRPGRETRFLLLGSAAPELVQGASESLAGRVEFVDLTGFGLEDVGVEATAALWWRGGFPRSFLATSDEDSRVWREQFVRTFLERDVPQLGLRIPAAQLRRFWAMVAHYHAQTWNSAEIAGALAIDEKTARRYLDLLTGTFLLRALPPWFENVGKRQRRAPKVYFRDSGLLHSLLGIDSPEALTLHPKLGASWEGFALEQVLSALPPGDAWFWAVHSGPELDLMVTRSGRRYGFEFKFVDAPAVTASLRSAAALLGLAKVFVVYPGTERFPLGDAVEALPLGALAGFALPP